MPEANLTIMKNVPPSGSNTGTGMAAGHTRRGCDLLKRGSVGEAVSEFRLAIELEPGSPEAYECLGKAYEELGRWDEALQVYRQLVRLRPDNAEFHYCLGTAYKNLCQWDKAVKSFEEALRLTSK